MPKIRKRHVSDSLLEKYTEKAYQTIDTLTEFKISGSLNTTHKNYLKKLYNQSGKYFSMLQHSYNGNIQDIDNAYNDSRTIDFISTAKNNKILNLPTVKIQNTNDYYITSDPYLLSQNEILQSNAVWQNLKVSDNIISSPNYINFEDYQTDASASSKNLDLINESFNENNSYFPFNDYDVYENIDNDFINNSIIYDGQEYNVGNEKRIEINLNFKENSPYLLNTQLFYKSGNAFYENDGTNSDDTFVTDQVNFLDSNIKTAITSQFLPNIVWNDNDNRWEYNVIDKSDDIRLNPYTFNVSNSSYEFPNNITNTYDSGSSGKNFDKTNELIFNHLQYIENSPIAFSSFYDNYNSLNNTSTARYKSNIPTKSYGFPNSSLWKTNKNHSISLKKYLAGDFLVEKIIIQGNIDIKAEIPDIRGNFVNHTDLNDNAIINNDNNFSYGFSHNKNTSDYISTGINFYLLNKINSTQKKSNYLPKIKGYTYKPVDNFVEYSSYKLSSNNMLNPYIDINLNDIKDASKTKLFFNQNEELLSIGDNEIDYLKYDDILSTNNNFLKKDEFNNITQDRLDNKFYYLKSLEDISYDPINNAYLAILNNDVINTNTSLYSNIENLSYIKQITPVDYSDTVEDNVENDLISHNSVSFIKPFYNIENINTTKINSDIVEVLEKTSISDKCIDVSNYNFKITSYINKNNIEGSLIGDHKFKVYSNYKYRETDPGKQKVNILLYNKILIEALFEDLYENTSLKIFSLDASNNPLLFGIDATQFDNHSGSLLASPEGGNYEGDFNIEFLGNKTGESHKVKYQLRYENFLPIDSNITLANIVNFISDTTNFNFNINTLNLKCLEIDSFVAALIKNEFRSLKESEYDSVLNRSFDATQGLYFEQLDKSQKTEVFTRLLDLFIKLSKHIIIDTLDKVVSDSFYVFSSDAKTESSNIQLVEFFEKGSDTFQKIQTYYYNDLTVSKSFFEKIEEAVSISATSVTLSDNLNSFINSNFNSVYTISGSNSLNDLNYPSFFEIIFTKNNETLQTLYTRISYEEDSVNIHTFEEGINIVEEKYNNDSKRNFYNSSKKSTNNLDTLSLENNKLIYQNLSSNLNKNFGYLLNKDDNIVVGINSFTGFNNIISYAKVNDALNITLIGREVHKKEKNESFETNSLKKSFSGNQRSSLIENKNKKGKYTSKCFIENKEYISDSIFPSVSEIYFDVLEKTIEDTEYDHKDTLDYYLSLDNLMKLKSTKTISKKIIFSNKEPTVNAASLSESVKDNFVTGWCDNYFLSKYKNFEAFKNKKLSDPYSDNNALFVYFNIDSYSLSHKYDIASMYKFKGMLNPDIRANKDIQSYAIDENNFFTIRKYLVPDEYNNSFYKFTLPNLRNFEESYQRHSGITVKSNNYGLTKDDLISLDQYDKQFSLNIDAISDNATIQYLKIPNVIYNFFNFESKNSIYKDTCNSWAIVLQDIQLKETLLYKRIVDIVSKNEYKEKLSFYKKTLQTSGDELIEYEVLYDKTFKIVSSDILHGYYRHNFYVVYNKDQNNDHDIKLVIPINFLYEGQSSIDTSESMILNKFYQIDFTSASPNNFDKEDFITKKSDGTIISDYGIIPLTWNEVSAKNKDVYLFSSYNKNVYGDIPRLIVDFYFPKYILKDTQELTNPVYNSINKEKLEKYENAYKFYKFKNSLSLFNLIEKKHFLTDNTYFDLLEKVIYNNNEKDLFLNKIVSIGVIYKKRSNKFIKTNNKVLYEIIKLESYPQYVVESKKTVKNTRSYINVIGILNKKEEFDENDLSCMLLYDIKNTDIIRIYDEKIKKINEQYTLNLDVPYVEIDLAKSNSVITDVQLEDEDGFYLTDKAIKYSHFSIENVSETPVNISNGARKILDYGSPIAKTNDYEKSKNFIYSFSANKKYKHPVDKVSGFRYGVYSPTPVKHSYHFNTNHYGQFKDKSYDTQNYSKVYAENNNEVKEVHCVNKNYVDNNYTFITSEEALSRPAFEGSNIDIHERVYYPYIESNDNSDMSYLYT